MAIQGQLNVLMSALESSGLIRMVQANPELEYLFKHVLAQEAVYNSLLKQQRRQWHLAVGDAVERAYPHQLDELAATLGRHFDEGGDDARAVKYLTAAGEQAARRYANVEAIMLFDRALEVAQRAMANGHPNEEALTHVYLRRGRLLEMSGRYADALASYEEMERIAHERNSRTMELQALMARATVFCAPTDLFNPERGRQATDRALALTRELGDRASEARVLWLVLLLTKFTFAMPEAIVAGEQSIAIARELGLKELLAFALNDIFPAYLASGQLDRAFEVLSEAELLWREVDNQSLRADTLTNLAELHVFKGNLVDAEKAVTEAHRICVKIDNVWGRGYSSGALGLLYHEKGEIAAALRALDESIHYSQLAGFAIGQTMSRGSKGLIFSDMGDYQRGIVVAREGYELAQKLIPTWAAEPQVMLTVGLIRSGELAAAERELVALRQTASPANLSALFLGLPESEFSLSTSDYEGVLRLADEYESHIRAYGYVLFLADTDDYRAVALMRLNRLDEAAAAAQRALAQIETTGSRRIRWRILAHLFEIENARGNDAAANEWRQRAREEISFIADHAPEDLRATFLAMPQVRAVVE